MAVVGVEARREWKANNSKNISTLSTKAWLDIIWFSLSCFYSHHCHQQSILYVDGLRIKKHDDSYFQYKIFFVVLCYHFI